MGVNLFLELFLTNRKSRAQHDAWTTSHRNTSHHDILFLSFDVKASEFKLSLILNIHFAFCGGESPRGAPSFCNCLLACFQSVFGRRKGEPSIEHTEANTRRFQLLLVQFGNVLHHTFKASRLLEVGSGLLVLVLWIDKL